MRKPQVKINSKNKIDELSKTTYERNSESENYGNLHKCCEESRPLLNCYGCDRQSFIKAKCSTCSPINNVASTEFSAIKLLSFSDYKSQNRKITKVKIKEIKSIFHISIFTDTGSMHCIAVETLY